MKRSFRRPKNIPLGKGSFGKSHKVDKDSVVVKMISIGSMDKQEIETFCQEYRTLGNSLQEKICFARLQNVSLTSQGLQCVTEFMEYNLPNYINREEIEPKIFMEEASRICSQVAEGLSFLHDPARKIIHRHLSPNNILIKIKEDGELRAVIADAGLAQTFESAFGSMKITADEDRYMAPEIHGNICNKRLADKFSPAVDVFSLGMILLEMCIGQPPEPLLASQSVQSDLQNLDDHHPLKELLRSCLRLKPQDRISALDVVQKLKPEKNFMDSVTRHDIQEMKKSLVSRYDKWKAVRAKAIQNIQVRDLENVIKTLNEVHRKVGIAKTTSSTTALIGGGMALGGFIASFFTAGIAIPFMIAGAAMAATGGICTAGSQVTEKVMSRVQLKNIREDIADDILESQALRKYFDKFDALLQRNCQMLTHQYDPQRQEAELYGCLQRIFDLPDFDDFMSSNNMRIGGIRSLFSAFSAASVTTTVGAQGARVAVAAFQGFSAAARAAHILGGITAAIAIPIDIYFIYTSISELKKNSKSEAAEVIQRLNEGMVLNEKSSEEVAEDFIQMKVHTFVRERQHQRHIRERQTEIRQREAQEHDESGENESGLQMSVEEMEGPEDYEGIRVGKGIFYAPY